LRSMSSVEEIFIDLFPSPTTTDARLILQGPECRPCLEMIKKSGTMKNSSRVLSTTLAILSEQSPEYLSCIGAQKDPDEPFARWSTNSRPLNVFDVHHMFVMVS